MDVPLGGGPPVVRGRCFHSSPLLLNTPREFWGLKANEWPGADRGADRGTGLQVEDFVSRLRTYLAQPGAGG